MKDIPALRILCKQRKYCHLLVVFVQSLKVAPKLQCVTLSLIMRHVHVLLKGRAESFVRVSCV